MHEMVAVWSRFTGETGEGYVLSRKLNVIRVVGGSELMWIKQPQRPGRRPIPSAGAGTAGHEEEEDEEMKNAKKLFESVMKEVAEDEDDDDDDEEEEEKDGATRGRADQYEDDDETKEDPRTEAERKTMELHLKLRTMYANLLGLANMTGRPLPPGDVPGLLTAGDPPSPDLPRKDGEISDRKYVDAVVTKFTLALDALEAQLASVKCGVKRFLTKALLA